MAIEEKLKKDLFDNIKKLLDLENQIEKRQIDLQLDEADEISAAEGDVLDVGTENIAITMREPTPEEIQKAEDEISDFEQRVLDGDQEIVFGGGSVFHQDNQTLKELYREYNTVLCNVYRLMVECKYYPIMGLLEDDLKFLKEQTLKGLGLFGAAITDQKPPIRYIDSYLEERFFVNREAMKERIKALSPLYLTFHIDPNTVFFYRQLLDCYVYGAFEATCVLARAIVETMTKKYIEYKGHGNLLAGNNRKSEQRSIADICINVLGMGINLIKLYKIIGNRADTILHKKERATEEEALTVIKLLQKFIEAFPKTV